MTTEEAIETLKANYPDACYEQLREAVDMAVSAFGAIDQYRRERDIAVKQLKELGEKIRAGDDCISREAAIDALMDEFKRVPTTAIRAKHRIEYLPSAQPERKKGKWIKKPEYYGNDISGFIDNCWTCDKCGKQAIVNSWEMYDLSNFCPNCGADMRGEQDE